eukprot:PhM_4_TR15722/c0_g1_i1/m.88230
MSHQLLSLLAQKQHIQIIAETDETGPTPSLTASFCTHIFVVVQRRVGYPLTDPHVVPLPQPAHSADYENAVAALHSRVPEVAGDRSRLGDVASLPSVAGCGLWGYVYSGVQFGAFTGPMGDGRCLSFATAPTTTNGGTGLGFEFQLKGIGRTAFSRHGDGRLSYVDAVREVVVGRCLAACGVPSVLYLDIVRDMDSVRTAKRSGDVSQQRCVLLRAAPCWFRVGTLEHLHFSGQHGLLMTIIRYVVFDVLQTRSVAPTAPDADVALALLDYFVDATARLAAGCEVWGYVHGVLNTDNASLLGLALDVGSGVFLDAYDGDHVAAPSMDTEGVYSFGKQTEVMCTWSCRVAECMSAFVADVAALRRTPSEFRAAHRRHRCDMWLRRLGVDVAGGEGFDANVVSACDDFFDWCSAGKVRIGDVYSVLGRALAVGDVDDAASRLVGLCDQSHRVPFPWPPEALADTTLRRRSAVSSGPGRLLATRSVLTAALVAACVADTSMFSEIARHVGEGTSSAALWDCVRRTVEQVDADPSMMYARPKCGC